MVSFLYRYMNININRMHNPLILNNDKIHIIIIKLQNMIKIKIINK
jgi:hypothetical protein